MGSFQLAGLRQISVWLLFDVQWQGGCFGWRELQHLGVGTIAGCPFV